MDYLPESIENASKTVITSLTVSDIAAAVDKGRTSRNDYASWVDVWFVKAFPTYTKHGIDGLALYPLRRKLLHEGLSSPSEAPAAQGSTGASHEKLIAFNIAENVRLHWGTCKDPSGDTWTVLDARSFCDEMVTAARNWMATRDAPALERLAALVDVRWEVPPLLSGIPVICAAI